MRLPRELSGTELVSRLQRLGYARSTFALGEALAHLHALWYDGRLKRSRDDGGVYRFLRG